MLNTNANTTSNLDKKIKDTAFVGFMAVCAISWAGFMGDGISSILLGAILIGLNLVRRSNGIKMGKASFMIGAFLTSMGLLTDATLYNPMILPLAVMMFAAYAIFNGLQK